MGGADNIQNVIRRYSSLVDTSGRETPRGIQMQAIMGGGVYPVTDSANTGDIMQGRISLSIIAALIIGALGFYWWTNEVQGGG